LALTLRDAFTLVGAGVHRGGTSRVTVRPGERGYHLWHGGGQAPIDRGTASAVAGATIVRGPAFSVGVVEHLLAALYALDVLHAEIEVEGDEIPILDGSAQPFVDAILAAGRVDGPEVTAIHADIAVDGASVRPGGPTWGVDVDFGPPPYPNGTLTIPANEVGFREISWARTFARASDVDALRAAGRGMGANLENTVIYGDDGPWRPERGPDEAIRHKLVDLVGDLALLGRPVAGRVHVSRGSHALHHRLIALL
jgi:UDP-3-O-[3-hydroxymyristoyl] N-acetylglucosamine deacetylase